MWWLLGFLPAVLLPLFNCLADRRTKAKNPMLKKEDVAETSKPKCDERLQSTNSSIKSPVMETSRKSSLIFLEKKSTKLKPKRVSFEDEVLGRSKKRISSSSARAEAAIKADQKAATLAMASVAAAPSQPFEADIRLEPQELLTASYGGLHSFNLVNSSKENLAFKVKCSDNQLYRVRPVFGQVEAGQSAKIEVLRHNGVIKSDKLVVVCARMMSEGPRASIADAAPEETVMAVVPLYVTA